MSVNDSSSADLQDKDGQESNASQPAGIPMPPALSPLESALRRSAEEAGAVPDTEADNVTSESEEASSGADETGNAESEEAAGAVAQSEPGEGGGDSADEDSAVPAVGAPSSPAVPEEDDEEEEQEEEDGEGGRMSLIDHLRELRKRLLFSLAAAFAGFLCCWGFVEFIFDILVNPLLAVLPEGSSAMYTTLPEAFFTRMYIAFICGLFMASPYIFYQIWAFIAPGLYEEEKRFLVPVALVSAVFFVAGALFCYFIVFHYAFSFFMSFTTQDIVAMPKISDYLDFVLKLILAFGFIFEMPIFSFFLSRMGVVTAVRMRSFRRYAILMVFIVAAILTPPDVVSQILMAVPMLLLYEVSILVAQVFGKKAAKAKAEAEGGNAGAAAAAAAQPQDEEQNREDQNSPAGGNEPEDQSAADTEEEPEAQAEAEPAEEEAAEEAAPRKYAPWDPRAELEAEEEMDLEALLAAEKAAMGNDDADRSAPDDDAASGTSPEDGAKGTDNPLSSTDKS